MPPHETMNLVVRGIGAWMIMIGLWFTFALVMYGFAIWRDGGVLDLGTVIANCLVGLYSGMLLMQCRERGRVLAVRLLFWAIGYNVFMILRPNPVGNISTLSLVLVALLNVALVVVLRRPEARRICAPPLPLP